MLGPRKCDRFSGSCCSDRIGSQEQNVLRYTLKSKFQYKGQNTWHCNMKPSHLFTSLFHYCIFKGTNEQLTIIKIPTWFSRNKHMTLLSNLLKLSMFKWFRIKICEKDFNFNRNKTIAYVAYRYLQLYKKNICQNNIGASEKKMSH